MKQINDKPQKIAQFLLPSWLELVFYGLYSLVVMGITNIEQVWKLLSEHYNINEILATQTLNQQLSLLNSYLSSDTVGTISIVIFWGLVVCLAYAITWTMQHLYFRIRNDVEGSKHKHVKKKTYWESKLLQHLLLIAVFFIDFSYIVLSFYVLPLVATFGRIAFQSFGTNLSWLPYLVMGLILGSLYSLILNRLWKVSRYTFTVYFVGAES